MRIFTNRSIKTLFLRIFLGLVVFTCLSIVSVAWKFKNVLWGVLLLSVFALAFMFDGDLYLFPQEETSWKTLSDRLQILLRAT